LFSASFDGLRALTFSACVALAVPGVAQAQQGGKPYAKVGIWQVQKYNGYCAATASFDGDRALRIHAANNGTSSFGFMGMGTANYTKNKVTYKFNDNRNRFTRDGVSRVNKAEDGGAPWVIIVDKAGEPSHAGDWATARQITFDYFVGSEQLSETFDLRGIDKAWERVWACSGG
jgi:hypothetical protein